MIQVKHRDSLSTREQFYTELLCSRSTMLEQRVSAFMIRSSGVWMLRANLRAMVIYLKEWKAATWI